MWAILIYVTIFLLFFRFCIKPLQHKYTKKPDEGIELLTDIDPYRLNNDDAVNSADIITNPIYRLTQ